MHEGRFFKWRERKRLEAVAVLNLESISIHTAETRWQIALSVNINMLVMCVCMRKMHAENEYDAILKYFITSTELHV